MSIINTGKSFASGEQLTAQKLNLMLSNASFATGAVDSSTMTVNSSGELSVNQITSSNIPNNAINESDLFQVDQNKFVGRTSSGTGDVEAVDISSIASLLRPKYVLATGGTTQTAGQAGSGVANLNRKIEAATDPDITYTYQMSDFTATGQTGFNYNQIIGIVVQCTVESKLYSNAISFNTGGLSTPLNAFLRVDNDSSASGDPAEDVEKKIRTIVTVPINAGSTEFKVMHDRNPASTQLTEHNIIGFMIMENLPSL